MLARALPMLFLSGCAIAVAPDDATDPTASDAGKQRSEGGTIVDPTPSGDAGVQDDSMAPADTGSQSTCASVFNGVLATFDFTNEPGNQASTPAKSTAPNVTATAMARSNAVTPTTGVNSINASNWTMQSQVDTTRYYAFSIAPPQGCTLDITQIAVDTKSSSTGPSTGSVATSADKFGQQTTFATNVPTKVSVTASMQTNTVEVRVYGYGASSTSGTMRIQNTLTISGALN